MSKRPLLAIYGIYSAFAGRMYQYVHLRFHEPHKYHILSKIDLLKMAHYEK